MSLERLRSGLSHEARQTLAGGLGSKATELLSAVGIDMQDYKSPEALIEETRAKLEAFAQQLHPNYQTDPSDHDEWLAEWKITWDEENNTPAIWNIDTKDGGPDTDCSLDVDDQSLTGELLLPSEMRITTLDCDDNQLTKLPDVLPAVLTELYCSNNRFPEGYIEQLKKRYPNVVIM